MKNYKRLALVGVMTVLTLIYCVHAQSLKPVSPSNIPESGTFYFLSLGDDSPPLPFNPYAPLNLPVYQVDSDVWMVDDDAIAELEGEEFGGGGMMSMDGDPPGAPGEGETNGGGGGLYYESCQCPSTNAEPYLCLEIVAVTNDGMHMLLHGTKRGWHYELLSKTNLDDPAWTFVERVPDLYATNAVSFSPVGIDDPSQTFFWARRQEYIINVISGLDAFEPTNSSGDGMYSSQFTFYVSNLPQGTTMTNLTVLFQISGTASNGVDYTNIASSIYLPEGTLGVNNFDPSEAHDAEVIQIYPKFDTLFELDEAVKITLLPSTNYTVSDIYGSATLFIVDNISSNLITLVTNIPGPSSVDYDPLRTNLVVSYRYFHGGIPNNFVRIGITNTGSTLLPLVTSWSSVSSVGSEVNLAVVKENVAGFVKGDVYFLSDDGIDRIPAANTNWIQGWSILTNAQVTTPDIGVNGGLYFDRTGVFGYELIAIPAVDGQIPRPYNVWRVNSNGVGTLLASIEAEHLENVITVPNTNSWGPWAGKILTGDKRSSPRRLFYTIDTNGTVTAFPTLGWATRGITSEDFDFIPADQDLYLCDQSHDSVMKLSRSVLTNHVGDLIVTQGGEAPNAVSALFILRWNGSDFDVWKIRYFRSNPFDGQIEHVSFAPIDIPSHPLFE